MKSKKISKNKVPDLMEECQEHVENSDSYLSTRRSEWDELEAMLIVKLKDDLSAETSSGVYDPRLSSMVYERVGRVVAQLPDYKAYANSKDDVGKNALMNLMLNYYTKHANEQFEFLTKLRMWDLYSHVYGTMFAMIPWRVNMDGSNTKYIGPELILLPMRDSFPQPNKSVRDADWFVARNMISLEWLKEQAKESGDIWDASEIKALEEEMKAGGDEGETPDANSKSFIEQAYYPSSRADKAFPQVETYTEYRKDKWITWTPKRMNSDKSRPHILRVLENPYPNNELPIVAKHSFPLLNSPIGIGEFARGKTLQYAVNSLINMYLDGVAYTLNPPLHVNPDAVVAESLQWEAGALWFMNNPNSDVQPMNLSPQGLNSFQSTYSFLVNALTNQSGTTDVMTSRNSEFTLGKTPAAVESRMQTEKTRDNWDLKMMDDSIKEVYTRWIALIVENQETDLHMRLFGDEIKEIQEVHPDVVEMFKSNKRGSVTANKKLIDSEYDFVLDSGSTYVVDDRLEQEKVTEVLKAVLENPEIIQIMNAKGKDIDIAELLKRWIKGHIKDWDSIVIDKEDIKAIQEEGMPEEQMPEEGMPPMPQPEMPQEPMPQPMPQGVPQEQFRDPQIAEVARRAAEMLGGIGGIPNVQ